MKEKRTYCQYDPSVNSEKAVGGLRIFVPATNGYVNYNLVHSVYESKNCDIWRLGKPYNKMYFVICNGAAVSKGDVWETTTKHAITNGSI